MSAVQQVRRSAPMILGAAIGLSFLIGVFAVAVGAYAVSNEWVEHTIQASRAADEWLASLLEAEAASRAFLLSNDLTALAPHDAALERERVAASDVRRLVADNAEQIRNVEHADRNVRAVIAGQRELVGLARMGHRDEAVARFAAGEDRLSVIAFRADVRRISEIEDRLLVERRAQARHWAIFALFGVASLAAGSYGLLTLAWRVQRARGDLLAAAAAEARKRLGGLSELAVALSEARTPLQVADIVVDLGKRVVEADTSMLYIADEAGDVLELLGERGTSPDVVEKIRRITATAGNPATFEAFRAGTTVWVENEADYAELYPALSKIEARGPRAKAFWSVPLVVEGRPVGLVGMGYYSPRNFSPEERVFIETVAHQCAQALLRASRLEGEDEARRWFTTTLKSIGDAVIATDADGRVTFMNHVAERLTGWPEREATGRRLEEVFCIVSEQTRLPVESPVARVLREGTVVGLANHTVLRSRSGGEIPIDDSGAPIRSEEGRLHGVVLVFRDVTNEKVDRVRRDFLAQAGEALVSSLDYQVTLATVANLAVPALADYCTVDVVDPATQALVQAAIAHVDPVKARLARELAERYPRDPNAERGVAGVVRTGKAELYERIPASLLERAARDPEHLRLLRELSLESAMIVPIRGRGRTFGAITFVHAGSRRAYTQDDLAFAEDFARRAAMAMENALAVREVEDARLQERALRGEAEVASRAKDEFLAMVSHELRTPLTAILGWVVMLRDRAPSPEVARGLAVIERNARAQTKLIEDVLDVSRIISGKLALNVATTDVAEVVATAVETVTPAAQAKDIRINADVPAAAERITADADRLQQIVWNLLSNAVKFTPKGGRIWVRTYRAGSDVCISVEDSGEGIRPDALPFIFEPFRQADASTTRRHGGLGLGLAIVKQLVSAHGGTVQAQSLGEGRGATFTVNLPARSAVPAVVQTVRTPAGTEPPPSSIGRAQLDGLKVLVIDDEEDALDLVGSVLTQYGAEVWALQSPADALESFTSVRPDVIVSDVGMPQMDGYALLRKIRALSPDSGGDTPAVALTAYARAEDAKRAFSAGYQVHVTKPVEPAKLAAIVAKLGGRAPEA